MPIWWTSALVATDIRDPETGGTLYAWAKVRPRWYWWLRRVQLFLGIVWRRYEVNRIDWRTAWDVAGVIHGNGLTARDGVRYTARPPFGEGP